MRNRCERLWSTLNQSNYLENMFLFLRFWGTEIDLPVSTGHVSVAEHQGRKPPWFRTAWWGLRSALEQGPANWSMIPIAWKNAMVSCSGFFLFFLASVLFFIFFLAHCAQLFLDCGCRRCMSTTRTCNPWVGPDRFLWPAKLCLSQVLAWVPLYVGWCRFLL